MKNLNRYTLMPIFIVPLHVVGCGRTTTAPKDWLPSVSVAQHEAFGGWISVRYITDQTGNIKRRAHGELIAIHSHQIFILTTQELISIPIDSISRVKLTIAQLSDNNDVNSTRQMIYPKKPLDAFRPYARYPQGLPKDIDDQSLKPKRPNSKISVSTEASKSPKKHRDPTKF